MWFDSGCANVANASTICPIWSRVNLFCTTFFFSLPFAHSLSHLNEWKYHCSHLLFFDLMWAKNGRSINQCYTIQWDARTDATVSCWNERIFFFFCHSSVVDVFFLSSLMVHFLYRFRRLYFALLRLPLFSSPRNFTVNVESDKITAPVRQKISYWFFWTPTFNLFVYLTFWYHSIIYINYV